jgi:hypothetical protein
LKFKEGAIDMQESRLPFWPFYCPVSPSTTSFTDPIYSLDISREDMDYYFLFVAWAVIIASFSAVRRRIEDSLRQTVNAESAK